MTRCQLLWIRPRLDTYRAAERRRFQVVLNRYPGIVIGVAVQVGQRVVGLRWGRPGIVRT